MGLSDLRGFIASFKYDLEWTFDAVLVNTVVGEKNKVKYAFLKTNPCVLEEKVSSIFTLKGFTGDNLGFAFCGKDKDRFIFVVAKLSKEEDCITRGKGII